MPFNFPASHIIWIGPDKPNDFLSSCRANTFQLLSNWNNAYHVFNSDDDVQRLFEAPATPHAMALSDLGVDLMGMYQRIGGEYCGRGSPKAIQADLLRMSILYRFGGVYFDHDEWLLSSLPKSMLADEIFFSRVRCDLIGEGVLGARRGNHHIRDLIIRYVTTQDPSTGICSFFLTRYWDEHPEIKVYGTEYFCPHERRDPLDDTRYRHTANTVGIHCWSNYRYDITRLREVAEQVREMNTKEPYEA